MNQTERFEAAVVGDGLASLMAGYLLKQFKITFIFAEVFTGMNCLESLENELNQLTVSFSYHNSPDGEHIINEMLDACLASVGIASLDSMDERDMERLMVRLEAELKSELADVKRIDKLSEQDGYYLASCFKADEEWNPASMELDCIICQEDVHQAALCAEAVYAEKQIRLGDYMKQLRIQEGTKEARKMVYLTHSRSWFYARDTVVEYAILQGVAPLSPFMNFGYYLDNRVDRESIIASCHQMIRACQEVWVFGPISEASLTDIVVAVMEGKVLRFFSIAETTEDIKELEMEKISFEREVHAGQVHKSDLLNFIRSTAPRSQEFKQMSLFAGMDL